MIKAGVYSTHTPLAPTASSQPLMFLIKALHPQARLCGGFTGPESKAGGPRSTRILPELPVALILNLSSAYKPVHVSTSQNILCEVLTPL